MWPARSPMQHAGVIPLFFGLFVRAALEIWHPMGTATAGHQGMSDEEAPGFDNSMCHASGEMRAYSLAAHGLGPVIQTSSPNDARLGQTFLPEPPPPQKKTGGKRMPHTLVVANRQRFQYQYCCASHVFQVPCHAHPWPLHLYWGPGLSEHDRHSRTRSFARNPAFMAGNSLYDTCRR